VSTQRFVDVFKKQASSRYRLKNWLVFSGFEPSFYKFLPPGPQIRQDPAGLSGKALVVAQPCWFGGEHEYNAALDCDGRGCKLIPGPSAL